MYRYQAFAICVLLYSLAIFVFPRIVVCNIFLFHVVFVPLLFKYSATFRRKLVFVNFVQWPMRVNFTKPLAYGLKGARNTYIEHYSRVDNCNIKLGIWHILPDSSYKKIQKVSHESQLPLENTIESELAHSKRPIMMYCHGNSNSRAASHRVRLYERFQEMDFHVIAFDYRGFGDSTNLALSEEGVVEDALVVYQWILHKIEKAKEKPNVFIWGHSLGTGIASHLVGRLEYFSELLQCGPIPLPNALILEAPFNNMADEVKHHPLSLLVNWLPYHITTFKEPFEHDKRVLFRSDVHLRNVKNLPILILHAKDDWVVPFRLGVRLYRSIKASRSDTDAPVLFKSYETDQCLGHKYICNAKDLKEYFTQYCDMQSNTKCS